MFSTKNVLGFELICFKEDLNKILMALINSSVQFRYVDNPLLSQMVIDNEKLSQEKDEKKRKLLMLHKYFGEYDSIVLISGWTPKSNINILKSNLNKTKAPFYIELSEPTTDDAPIIIHNPSFLSPFEMLVKLYSAPNYGDIDPTPIFAITFLITFGIMFSDVIGGAVLFGLSLLMYLKYKSNFFKLGIYLGLSGIFFGFLFGEAGGFEIPPLLFRTFEHPIKFLYVALGFGLFHISLGHFIGFINKIKKRQYLKAVSEHISFILMILGAVLFVVKQSAAPYLILIGFLLLFIKGEVKDIVELPSLLGNTISYSRLLAINLAHIGITKAFTMLSVSMHGVVSIFIFLFGQIIMLTLGLIVAFVHSLRLHFVEFFTKFVGNGVWFKPYGIK